MVSPIIFILVMYSKNYFNTRKMRMDYLKLDERFIRRIRVFNNINKEERKFAEEQFTKAYDNLDNANKKSRLKDREYYKIVKDVLNLVKDNTKEK